MRSMRRNMAIASTAAMRRSRNNDEAREIVIYGSMLSIARFRGSRPSTPGHLRPTPSSFKYGPNKPWCAEARWRVRPDAPTNCWVSSHA